MQLWPMLLWPMPKARQYTQKQQKVHNSSNSSKIHFPLITKTIFFFHYHHSLKWLLVFIINVLVLIRETQGSTAVVATTSSIASQPPVANYQGVDSAALRHLNMDVVSALTGLSNGYGTINYMKNYYQVREPEENEFMSSAPQQQQLEQQREQQRQQTNGAGIISEHQGMETATATGIIGRGFMDLHSNNYGKSIAVQGAGGGGGSASIYKDAYNVHDSGFVPTTLTAAGQHYAATLSGLEMPIDTINALQRYGITATALNTKANKKDLYKNRQQYENDQSNSNSHKNNIVAANDNNKSVQQSLFRRLTNYGGINMDGARNVIPNYTLAYVDNAKQSAMLQNFYNERRSYNSIQPEAADINEVEIEQQHQQNFASYFRPTAEYETENQENYYVNNNAYQLEKQKYGGQYKLEALTKNFNNGPSTTTTIAPATYYQTYIHYKNDNKAQQQQQQYYDRTGDNYQTWKQNQITDNYQQKQSARQQHLLQEPETAETTHTSTRIKKSSSKHKSKRSYSPEHHYNSNSHNYSPIQHTHNNDIENDTEDLVNTIQLEQLQHQLQQQQQRFIELQHQLIDQDQQLQIQKQLAHIPPANLPPITHTVHHNPQSLQTLAGIPISKHIQIIKSIPMQQHQQVHVPYKQNVPIEIPDPVIDTVNKPTPIEIPVTKTVTVPNVQELKIPIERIKPFPVVRPIPYIVEKKVPFAVEKQIAKPVYYPVPIKVPIVHTVVHKMHHPHNGYGDGRGVGNEHYHQPHVYPRQSFHLPYSVYRTSHKYGHGHNRVHDHGRGGYGQHYSSNY